MLNQPGYCAQCGADIRRTVAWLNLAGEERCTACAIEAQAVAVRTPVRPEARDDGR